MNKIMNIAIIIVIGDKMKLPWESYNIMYQQAFRSSKIRKAFSIGGQDNRVIREVIVK